MPLSDAKTGMASALNRFFNSVAYPICLAALCAFSGLGDKSRYSICMGIIALCVLLTVLYSKDNKPLFAPMLMSFCALGQDENRLMVPGFGDVIAAYDTGAFAFVIFLGIGAVTALLIRFWKEKTLLDIFQKPSLCTIGILAMDVAFVFNGAFSTHWRPINLLYGLLMAFGFTFFYFICASIARRSENVLKYTCQCMVCASLLVLAQVLVRVVQNYEQILISIETNVFPLVGRSAFQFDWGIPNTVSAFLVLGIPAAFYLAANERHCALSYVLAFAIFAGVLSVGVRSAVLVGAATVLMGVVACCFGRNRRWCRIFGAVLAVLCVAALLLVCCLGIRLSQLCKQILFAGRFDKMFQDGRLTLWATGLTDFLENPLFGVGFEKGAWPIEEKMQNVYSNMYHNVFVQFPASMGTVGVLAFGVHLLQLLRLLRKATVGRFLLLLLPGMILGMSVVDNFYFYLNQQIAYCIFLGLAERMVTAERQDLQEIT